MRELQEWLERVREGELSPDAAVETLIAIYQDAAGQIAQLTALQVEAKKQLADVILETGDATWRTPAGSCYVSAPSVVTSYDARGLDAMAAADPRIAALLAPHRRQSERHGTLTICPPRAGRQP